MISLEAHGKLLITGEYVVLEGAQALAVPLSLGQSLELEETDSGLVQWHAWHPDGFWFHADLSLVELFPIRFSHKGEPEAYRLASILRTVESLNPELFSKLGGLKVRTQLDFLPSWGMGSSSTLISLLARWADVDPFVLLERTFKGSGYDIACAQASGPIIYKREKSPTWQSVTVSTAFSDAMVVYSGRKQDSRKAIADYREREPSPVVIDEIDAMARAFAEAPDVLSLMSLMRRHEELLSELLGQKTISEEYFPDFDGQLKSLGAWGGDFFLALSGQGPGYMKSYFERKGLKHFFKWEDIVL